MRSHATLVAGLLALVVSGLSCHAGDLLNSSTTGKPPVGAPAHQVAFTTQPGSAATGAPLPTVRVGALDTAGRLVPAYSGAITIALGTNPGSGTLTGTLSETAVNGVATFTDLRIDKSGTGYTLRASASGLTAATSQPFDVSTSQPPPPPPATQLRFTVQPQSTQAGQSLTPAVQVSALDANGTVVSTFTGTIAVAIGTNPASGTLLGTLTTTAVAGVATFSNLSIDHAGTGYTLQATSAGLTSATSSAFAITAPPPPPATQLRFTVQPTNTLPLTTITPAVEVTALDAQGNPVTGFTGSITIAIGHDASLLGNAVLSGTLTVTAVNGVARFSNLSIDEAGVGYTLRATATGLTSAESAAFNVGTP